MPETDVKPVVQIADSSELYQDALSDVLSHYYRVLPPKEVDEATNLLEETRRYRISLAIVGNHQLDQRRLDLMSAYKKISVPVLAVIDRRDTDAYLRETAGLPADGLLDRDCKRQLVMEAIEAIKIGGIYIDNRLASKILMFTRDSRKNGYRRVKFSGRELDVLKLVGQGKKNKHIAQKLCIDDRTVGNHITNIYEKAMSMPRFQHLIDEDGNLNRAALAVVAMDLGLTDYINHNGNGRH